MRKFLLPLLFILLFIAESLFVQFLPGDFFGGNRILAPRFLFSALLLLTIFVGRKKGIIYAAIFGLIFDIVYIEIIGIYLFLFPFVAYVISKIMHVLQANIIVAYFVSILGIALLEIGVYEMDYLIHVTNLDFLDFLNLRLYPTLILNAAFLLIFIYPLKRYFEKYAEALRDE
ncbi:rod shape-determining protein MreD [Neobacillus mesonae]|uniref:Rod shape-determining protein MreD n=1 Tax=Neobacillus mesonae TaxID=1193713 RepID=A0A3T0I2D3_9BACI|nr:rod shape-determining protein MreD [Neobacillus mesonae]AZU63496.1 rod shape-determining protein MreD [Neobacillus mesonae]MED4203189.1 rod shape-determining protein MreD [Neobacillus mesonae]